MASSYHVDSERGLVIVRPTGRFTETGFIDLCWAVYDDPEREPHFSVLWDARAIDELAMDASVISMYRQFLSENEHRITEGKIAVVADRGMAERFASMLIEVSEYQAPTYQLFPSVDAAAEWLDLSPEALSNISRL